MSFFDNTKTLGLVLLIVGILYVIGAILVIAAGFVDLGSIVHPPEGVDPSALSTFCIISGIGALLAAIVYMKNAMAVRSGAISAKIDVLACYVQTVGLAFLISGIFDAIAAGVAVGGAEGIIGAIIGAIFIIIIALIIMFIGRKINDGKQTTGDKIIWVILLLAFLIMLVLNILGILADPIGGIAGILISLFMLGFLFDSDVKRQMGM